MSIERCKRKDLSSPCRSFCPPAVLNMDNSVVDLETLQALYENVSTTTFQVVLDNQSQVCTDKAGSKFYVFVFFCEGAFLY